MKVVVFGLSQDLLERFKGFFYDLDVSLAGSLLEVQNSHAALLVLEHAALGEDPLGALDELHQRFRAMPIIYCLPPGDYDRAGLAERLVHRMGVKRVLATPVDLSELARSAASELGIRMRPQAPRRKSARSQTLKALAGLWLKFRAANLARVHALEMAAEVLMHGELEANASRHAEREMHKLVGSAGTFGFQEASLLAREAESLLSHAQMLTAKQRLHLGDSARQLRGHLEGAQAPGLPAATPDEIEEGTVLAVTANQKLVNELGTGRGFRLTSTNANEEALFQVRKQLPGALLLDTCTGELASRIQLLKEMSWEFPQLPMLVLTGEQGLHSRLALTEMGGVEVLSAPYDVARVQEELRTLLERKGQLGVKVLAVDDDPSILQVVKSILEPVGLAVEGLSDPTQFWEALELSSPDLILLDLDMPYLSGLDLCRVLRSDPRWSDRPVLFLTSYFDTNTVQRIYQAGADDYINKPVVDSELVARISNRLARTQHYRRLADTDLLTGVATRRRGLRDLTRLLQLARRQNLPLAVAILDLDHFKNLNDRYGHGTGDLALRVCARHLISSFRGEDTVSRWGGEEFVVGLLASNGLNAQRRLENILASLQSREIIDPNGNTFHLSFSGGVAQYPEDASDLDNLLRLADKALYRAKEEGRARVYGSHGEITYRRVDVAVVENDEVLANAVQQACQARGWSTEWLKGGDLAADVLTADPIVLLPRAVLLDEDPHDLIGSQVRERLVTTETIKRFRVILMTASLQDGEIQEALDGGVFDYIPKPFALSALIRRLEFALEGR